MAETAYTPRLRTVYDRDIRAKPESIAGGVLAMFGFLFETVADAQLVHFKADPANKGKVLDRGLWRYTRHPNYFGEFCFWWGAFLIAAQTPLGQWSIPGPLVVAAAAHQRRADHKRVKQAAITTALRRNGEVGAPISWTVFGRKDRLPDNWRWPQVA